MKKIVAIGGGPIDDPHSLVIHREIILGSGQQNPRVLFIPTASQDELGYREKFRKVYHQRLGCQVEELLLISEKPSSKTIRDKIAGAEVIYVGGGNTLMMMNKWRKLGIDQLLDQAATRGAILSGSSAGALCWFDYGHSDSRSFYVKKDWEYIRVRGLGFIPATGCPHYDAEKRDRSFQNMIRKMGTTGIALDNFCALEVFGSSYRVISAKRGAWAFRLERKRGKVFSTLLDSSGNIGAWN
ncbi:MAG: Type 1 glutamine amidotransferase-like domain-containing protein [Chitinophagaceae bacterium]